MRIFHFGSMCQKANLSKSLGLVTCQKTFKSQTGWRYSYIPVFIHYSFCMFSELELVEFPLKSAYLNTILLKALN